MDFGFNSLIGKTIERVEEHTSERLNGITNIELHFTDGTTMEIQSHGCDEGGWMTVRD